MLLSILRDVALAHLCGLGIGDEEEKEASTERTPPQRRKQDIYALLSSSCLDAA